MLPVRETASTHVVVCLARASRQSSLSPFLSFSLPPSLSLSLSLFLSLSLPISLSPFLSLSLPLTLSETKVYIHSDTDAILQRSTGQL